MLRRTAARPSRTARAIATARAVGTDRGHDPVAAAALPARDGAVAAALHAQVARHRAVDRAATYLMPELVAAPALGRLLTPLAGPIRPRRLDRYAAERLVVGVTP